MSLKDLILQALSIGPALERLLDTIKKDIFSSIIAGFLCGGGIVFISVSFILLLHQLDLPVWAILAIIGSILLGSGFLLWRSSSGSSRAKSTKTGKAPPSEFQKMLEEVGTIILREFLEGFKAHKKTSSNKYDDINNKI